MSEIPIPMSLPLDADGFLRRECPTCERQFKWWHTPPPEESSAEETQEVVEAYFCPYCYEPADPNGWCTEEQLECARQLAAAEVLGPELRRFQKDMEHTNRQSRGISFNVSLSSLSRPGPLTELDDMVRVDVPCHPEEPSKVDEEWDREVACLACGVRYPIELVRALPEADTRDLE